MTVLLKQKLKISSQSDTILQCQAVFINGCALRSSDSLSPRKADVRNWANWFRAYKGFDHNSFEIFQKQFNRATNKTDFLAEQGIHIFRTHKILMLDILKDLDEFLASTQNACLIGFSYGAHIVMHYICAQSEGNVRNLASRFVLLNAPYPGRTENFIGAHWPIGTMDILPLKPPFELTKFCNTDGMYESSTYVLRPFSRLVINLYSAIDKIGRLGYLKGAINIQHNSSKGFWKHERPGYNEANQALWHAQQPTSRFSNYSFDFEYSTR